MIFVLFCLLTAFVLPLPEFAAHELLCCLVNAEIHWLEVVSAVSWYGHHNDVFFKKSSNFFNLLTFEDIRQC